MYGLIIGDIVGSRFEKHNNKNRAFDLFHEHCRFTDDTVLACATMGVLLSGGDEWAGGYRSAFLARPHRGYGPRFRLWAVTPDMGPYGSCGNGSAVRAAPIGAAFDNRAEVMAAARQSAECTHNHRDGTKYAEAVAYAVFLARQGEEAEDIRRELLDRKGIRTQFSTEDLVATYRHDFTAAGSVPQALHCALSATDFEDAIRTAISIGGDSDTIAAIAGAVAEPLFGIPEGLVKECRGRLPKSFLHLLDRFYDRFYI